jgi:hypothetical protein
MLDGKCTCGGVTYRLTDRPMFVHACHCTWCQRETGTAFATNALIETACIQLTSGAPVLVETPSASGKGQLVARCPHCQIALFSHYGGHRDLAFVRVGTLIDPAACPPDIHIFTSTKQPWVILPQGVPAVAEYYSSREMWPQASLARRAAVLAGRG